MSLDQSLQNFHDILESTEIALESQETAIRPFS